MDVRSLETLLAHDPAPACGDTLPRSRLAPGRRRGGRGGGLRLCSLAPPGGECEEDLAPEHTCVWQFLLREEKGVRKDERILARSHYMTTAERGVHEAGSQIVLRREGEKANVWTVFVSQSPQNKSVENACGVLTLFCA